MIDEELRIDAEHLVQSLLPELSGGHTGDIPHGEYAAVLEAACISPANAPEIRKGTVVPHKSAIGHLVKLCYADAVLVRRHFLCHYIHGYLAEVHIGAYASRSGYARGLQNVPDHSHGQLMGGHAVGLQVSRGVDEHLVYGVNVDILGSDVLQVYLIYSCAVSDVVCHTGRCHDVGQLQRRVLSKLRSQMGLSREASAGRSVTSRGVDVSHLCHHLEKPGPAGNAAGFQ